ncbi:MAG: hypothetical protein ACYS8X_07860 [Planctomycetota bacterium]|jgi:hypothetical protein
MRNAGIILLLVAFVVGVAVEYMFVGAILPTWRTLDGQRLVASWLSGLGLPRAGHYFGVVWANIPRWVLVFALALFWGLLTSEHRTGAALACAAGFVLAAHLVFFRATYRGSYGQFAAKFILLTWTMEALTFLVALLGASVSGSMGRPK